MATDELQFCAVSPDLLDLVLHHAKGVLDVRDVCCLVCTSKTATTAATQHFGGQLALQLRPVSLDQAVGVSSWVSKHGRLLHSLEFAPQLPRKPASLSDVPPGLPSSTLDNDQCCPETASEYKVAASTALALGLRTAFLKGLLPLASFKCIQWDAVVPPLLQALPSSLTHLQLHWNSCTDGWFKLQQGPSSGSSLTQALEQLPGLRSLHLTCSNAPTLLAPAAFKPLSQLTELVLTGVQLQMDHLEQLPAALQRLHLAEVTPDGDINTSAIDLSHLTALTELCLGMGVIAGDLLPPNLAVFQNYDFIDDDISSSLNRSLESAVLLPLKGLKHLDGWIGSETFVPLAAELTALTSVMLKHDCSDPNFTTAAAAAGAEESYTFDGGLKGVVCALSSAGAAASIRAVQLGLEGSARAFGAPLIQQLARLPSMTSLGFCDSVSVAPDGVAQLCLLSGLCKLDLWGCRVSVQALQKLPGAVSRLPGLQKLRLPCAVRLSVAQQQPQPAAAGASEGAPAVAAATAAEAPAGDSRPRCHWQAVCEELAGLTQLHSLHLHLAMNDTRAAPLLAAPSGHLTEVHWACSASCTF